MSSLALTIPRAIQGTRESNPHGTQLGHMMPINHLTSHEHATPKAQSRTPILNPQVSSRKRSGSPTPKPHQNPSSYPRTSVARYFQNPGGTGSPLAFPRGVELPERRDAKTWAQPRPSLSQSSPRTGVRRTGIPLRTEHGSSARTGRNRGLPRLRWQARSATMESRESKQGSTARSHNVISTGSVPSKVHGMKMGR